MRRRRLRGWELRCLALVPKAALAEEPHQPTSAEEQAGSIAIVDEMPRSIAVVTQSAALSSTPMTKAAQPGFLTPTSGLQRTTPSSDESPSLHFSDFTSAAKNPMLCRTMVGPSARLRWRRACNRGFNKWRKAALQASTSRYRETP